MTSLIAVRVETIDDLKATGQFYWTGMSGGKIGRMMFVCPCGCGSIAGVTIKPVAANGWEWNGNLDKPSLTPSIRITGGKGRDGDCWHGYLTDGVFKSC